MGFKSHTLQLDPNRRWGFSYFIGYHWTLVDGWIPCEQILGAETLSRVPTEFVPQHPTNRNPPTLFLSLCDIVNGLKNNEFTAMDRSEISLFLEHAFERLEAWFQWFNTTQSGNQMSSYCWHGRDNRTVRELNPKMLSSGFDDYPRASHPSGDERHLDLRFWMLLAADCMHSIEELLDKETKPGKNCVSTAKLIWHLELLNLVQLKWKEMETGQNHASRQLVRMLSIGERRLLCCCKSDNPTHYNINAKLIFLIGLCTIVIRI